MMDWWRLLEYGAVLYVAFGAYCGISWTVQDDDEEWPLWLAVTLGSLLGVIMWPFCIGGSGGLGAPKPVKKTKRNKAAIAERKRMDNDYRNELARVEVLEVSADHRKRMAVLDERRQKVEEIV